MVQHLITFMLATPVLGAILQTVIGGQVPASSRDGETNRPSADISAKPSRLGDGSASWAALSASLASAICGVALVAAMHPKIAEPQIVESLPWIGSYAISYELGLDGLSAPVVILISLVFPLLIAAEWTRATGRRGIHGLLLILQASLLGAVCAQDLFLLFFFWSMSALPFYFLIGIWGGADRESAAFRSIVTAALGNALFFGALLVVYYSAEPNTFSLRLLSQGGIRGTGFEILGYSVSTSDLAFFLMTSGLILRAPIWPFHGWFTKVAVEAPATVLVASVVTVLAVAPSIFMRLSTQLFPETLGKVASAVVVVGVVNLLVGGVCAVAQRGLRSLLAFVALGELGLLLMGVGSLSQAGFVGAVYQQLVVGLALAALGLLVGVISERTRSELFTADSESKDSTLGGVALGAPGAALVAAIASASILGVPGVGGFVSHALLVIGGYSFHPFVVIAAGGALLLGTYTVLNMYRRVFLGQTTALTAAFEDLRPREKLYLVPVVIALVGFGVYPKPLLDLVRPTVLAMLSSFN